MKRFWPFAAWFLVGAVLGQFTETVLFPALDNTGYHDVLAPVMRWLATHGWKHFERIWLAIYLYGMSWLIAAVVSIVGGFFVKRHLFLNMLLFGIGFAFVPLALWAYLYSSVPVFACYVDHGVIVGIAIICGLLSHRFGLIRANRKHCCPKQDFLDGGDPSFVGKFR